MRTDRRTDRRARRTALVVLVAVFGLAACGGGGGGDDDAADEAQSAESTTTTIGTEFVDDLNGLCTDLFATNGEVSDVLFANFDDLDLSDPQDLTAAADEFQVGAAQLDGAVEQFDEDAGALDLPDDVQQAVDDTVDTMNDLVATHEDVSAALEAGDAEQLSSLGDQYSGELADRLDALGDTYRELGLEQCAGSETDTSTTPTTLAPATGGDETAASAFTDAIEETGVTDPGTDYETFETVTDDTGQLSIDVPSEWSDRDTSTTTPGSGNPEIIASTNLDSLGDGEPRLDIFVLHESADRDVQEVLDTMAGGAAQATTRCSAEPAHVFEVANGAGAIQAYSGCNGRDEAWLFVAFTDTDADILTGLATYAVTNADLDAISNGIDSVSFTP